MIRHALLMTGDSNIAQVSEVSTEARAEAEAAAEARFAAALEHERAELVTQACSWLCMCGDGVAICIGQTLCAARCG
jgi:hypothetical protein